MDKSDFECSEDMGKDHKENTQTSLNSSGHAFSENSTHFSTVIKNNLQTPNLKQKTPRNSLKKVHCLSTLSHTE